VGHEGWFTGVEKRGVVKVADDTEKQNCLSTDSFQKTTAWGLLSSFDLTQNLNPVAEDVVGDLYYEMHEESGKFM
jgi:hypothetical protein